ncbi:MAG: SOS response-associated peptidase, partial [Chloroflexota bacterium]
MCGRMTQRTDPAVVAELFGAELRGEGVDDARPRYNIAPTDPLLVVLRREEARVVTRVRWGLIPPWAKAAAEGARMFNARAETVATSPAFRSAFAKRRCLVPTEGFYEWDKVSGSRQPYLIAPGACGLLALAGIWSAWKDPETGLWVPCASVITTAADATVGAIHDRMPVPLPEAAWDRWLDPALPDPGEALGILGAAAPALVLVPVSRAVNSVRNDGPELIAPVDPAAAPEPPPSRARATRRASA